jgi:hypothetical protein
MECLTMLQDLIGWVVALTLAMVLWTVILLASAAMSLTDMIYAWEIDAALGYVLNFGTLSDIRMAVRHILIWYLHLLGKAMSYIFILCIAKHAAWSNSTVTDPLANMVSYGGVTPQQQYDYERSVKAADGVYYYQQAAVHHDPVHPIRA